MCVRVRTRRPPPVSLDHSLTQRPPRKDPAPASWEGGLRKRGGWRAAGPARGAERAELREHLLDPRRAAAGRRDMQRSPYPPPLLGDFYCYHLVSLPLLLLLTATTANTTHSLELLLLLWQLTLTCVSLLRLLLLLQLLLSQHEKLTLNSYSHHIPLPLVLLLHSSCCRR